jgi:hypothetical protein
MEARRLGVEGDADEFYSLRSELESDLSHLPSRERATNLRALDTVFFLASPSEKRGMQVIQNPLKVGDRVFEQGKEGRVTALRPSGMVDVKWTGSTAVERRAENAILGPMTQFHAQAQGVYESMVKKKLKAKEFVTKKGRIDKDLPREEVSKLLGAAHKIAKGLGNKSKLLKKGQQQPTAAGLERVRERSLDMQHELENIKAYEQTLAMARLSPAEKVSRAEARKATAAEARAAKEAMVVAERMVAAKAKKPAAKKPAAKKPAARSAVSLADALAGLQAELAQIQKELASLQTPRRARRTTTRKKVAR